MRRNRAKARSAVRATQIDDRSVERDLPRAEISTDEGFMAKAKADPATRKMRMDRGVQAALDVISRSKKKSKKPFPATPLQRRMQSGDI